MFRQLYHTLSLSISLSLSFFMTGNSLSLCSALLFHCLFAEPLLDGVQRVRRRPKEQQTKLLL